MVQNTPQINKIDRRLWQRFIEVALPYWYPSKKKAGMFFFMLLMLLIFLFAVLFITISAIIWLGQQFFPDFTQQAAGGLINLRQKVFSDSIYQIGLILALILPLVLFGWRFPRIKGRANVKKPPTTDSQMPVVAAIN